MFEYEAWEKRRVLDSLPGATDWRAAPRIFGRILAAQQTWIPRLRAEDSRRVDRWQALTLEQRRARLEELAAEISESNQAGKQFRSTPSDIPTHPGDAFSASSRTD